MRSPATNFLLPGTTYSRLPPREALWMTGSEMPRVGIETFSPPSPSPSLRRFSASAIASLTSPRARSMKRCRLVRLLPLGLGRRSMMFIGQKAFVAASAGLVHAHVPFHQAADLALSIAARHHPLQEIAMLALGLAVLLAAEADDRQQVLDLREHA